MDPNLECKMVAPHESLAEFVQYFWCLRNHSDEAKPTTGLPDGLVDVLLFRSGSEPFRIVLLGGLTHQEAATVPPHSVLFCVSFKFLAVEYILREPVADIVNTGKRLPPGFWGFTERDLDDFDAFVAKATATIRSLLPSEIDPRKRNLFALLYASKGNCTVKELSEKVFWSSRQVNRYFNRQFGISLKAYCTILRFRASLEHLAEGRLFPEENFTDQNHFIKEVKKFSGVVPKELAQNKNDRFILLYALKQN